MSDYILQNCSYYIYNYLYLTESVSECHGDI